MRGLWVKLALTALRAVRPYLRMNAEQSLSYQVVVDLLESLRRA